MSTATKVKRFMVTYRGRRFFQNVSTPNEALARVRSKLLGEPVAEGEERDQNLATSYTFMRLASVEESLRY